MIVSYISLDGATDFGLLSLSRSHRPAIQSETSFDYPMFFSNLFDFQLSSAGPRSVPLACLYYSVLSSLCNPGVLRGRGAGVKASLVPAWCGFWQVQPHHCLLRTILGERKKWNCVLTETEAHTPIAPFLQSDIINKDMTCDNHDSFVYSYLILLMCFISISYEKNTSKIQKEKTGRKVFKTLPKT